MERPSAVGHGNGMPEWRRITRKKKSKRTHRPTPPFKSSQVSFCNIEGGIIPSHFAIKHWQVKLQSLYITIFASFNVFGTADEKLFY